MDALVEIHDEHERGSTRVDIANALNVVAAGIAALAIPPDHTVKDTAIPKIATNLSNHVNILMRRVLRERNEARRRPDFTEDSMRELFRALTRS